MNIFDTAYSYLIKGGIVVIPIIINSIAMWTFIFARLIWFHNIKKRDLDFGDITKILNLGKISPQYQGIKSYLIRDFLMKKTGDPVLDKKIAEESFIKLNQVFDKHIAVITILAAVSPLFGLLGTVTGMIETFDVITFFGTGNPRAMAAGISEALVTTQTGLLAAIPGMFMAVYLSRKAKRAKDSAQEAVMIIKRSIK